MNDQKIVILNITHGDHPYMDRPPFLPIAAGACRNDIFNDACGEDNISDKNKWYGDFTSLYWAWKNLKGVDIIGISHYRRYLADDNFLNKWKDEYLLSWQNIINRKYHANTLVQLLQKCDFVMLKSFDLGMTIREQYIQCHPYPENLDYVTETLREIHPDSVNIWLKLLDEHLMQPGYLFLTKKQKFDELCEWIYPVLVELEKKIDISKYDGYQSRVIAFLYERLVPVFIRLKGYRVEQRAMYMIDPASTYSIKDYKHQRMNEIWKQKKRKFKRIVKSIFKLK